MVAKSYDLNFDGYWRVPNIGGLPDGSGIYDVYACVNNVSAGTVTLNRLLYTGEAQNVRERVAGHEKSDMWRRQLQAGEELCFNAALIGPSADRLRAEAAMIFKHKPPCNTEFVNDFPYDQTTITTRGRNALLAAQFTVYPTTVPAGIGGYSRW